jgi:hypothetical protein
MNQSNLFAQLITVCITGFSASLIYGLLIVDTIDLKTSFVLLNLLLLLYLTLEIKRFHRLYPARWLINPIVLCSLMTFILSLGVTNVIYFLPEDMIASVGLYPEITTAMNKLMLLVIVGAIAMWLGYWSSFATRFARQRVLIKLHNKFFSRDTKPKAWVLPLLVFLGVASRLIQIQLGVFGYSSSYDLLIEAGSYTQYLSMVASLGKLALVMAAFQYYSSQSSHKAKVWLWGIITIEILFGFLSGMKSAVAIPLVILLLCQYLRSGRFSYITLVAIFFAISVAYTVIEPFRAMKNADSNFTGNSLVSIISLMAESTTASSSDSTDIDDTPVIISTMARSNYTWVGSLGIEFADSNETLPEGSPTFLEDILLSPIHAWVPRFLWESKSLGNLGIWYTQVVMGRNLLSATTPTPFTYLYFAGGTIAVFIGFFSIGCIQRVLFFITNPLVSSAGGLVFFSMLTTLVLVSSTFNSVFITLFRELPIMLILQSFFYRRISERCEP